METKRKNIIIFGSIALFVIVLISVFAINYVISNTLDNLNFEIVAEKLEQGEILTDTNFIVKAEKNYSSKIMKKIVSIEPDIDYTLEKTAKGTYLITPQEKLNDSSIYNIYITANEDKPALSWAFQTKEEFKVTGNLPFSDMTHIEQNTGIEINFSKQLENIEEYFEITPKVEGRFEYYGKKVIFIPNELLAQDTVYKVTIKKGLKSYFNDELKDDYTFSFRTISYKPYLGLINGYQETIKPTDIPKILISSAEAYNGVQFNLAVYKLNSVQEYTNYLETHYKNVEANVGEDYDHNFDVSNHTKILAHSLVLEETNESWQHSLTLPTKLPIGWYIVDITNSLNDIHFQKALQVSDISVYTYGLNGDIRVWLNDSASGEILSGATVQLGDLAAISNKDGVASFNIAKDERQKLIITTKDGKEFGEYIRVTEIEESSLTDDYYMYIYTDRKQYLPTDTINYWGVIIPRKTNIERPNEVEVVITSDIKQTTKVNKNGVFSGSINIVSHESTWAGVGLKVGDREDLYMSEISISDYTKPVYKLSSDFSKDYYKKGDKIELNVYGKFYDGTSAENVKVKVSTNNDEYRTVTLNANGEAKAVLEPYTVDSSGDISYLYTTLEIEGIDEYATAYNNVLYFPTDYHIENDWNSSNKKLTLTTNKINYNAINNKAIDYSNIYSGESFEQNVYAEVVEIRNEKRYTGETHYDIYSGTSYPEYTYHRIENVIETYNLVIPKGEKLEIDIPKIGENEEVSYEVRITYTYPDGFSGSKTIYVWAGNDYSNGYYYFSTDNRRLKEDETAKLTLSGRENKNGRMLYVVSTDRINKLGVTNNDNLDVKMSKELIPNCFVSGAFFDGNRVYRIETSYLYFNPLDKELSIDIKTDKESYRPGEKVKATAKVTDINGEPVQCNFLFSVVDEASLFDTYERDILDMIYEERYHFAVEFTSDVSQPFGGEGGGGGDEIRDTFTDVLAFESLDTNENGEAEVEFTVSDDLTSWRITAIAISEDVRAGKTTKNITTSIPFFINQVLNKKYIVNDDVSLSVRTAGVTASLLSSYVSYEAKILSYDGNVIKTEVKEAKPFEAIMFNFGKLETGKYKVQITATSGENKDTILKEFEVVPSLHEISLTKEINISEIEKLNAVKFPIHLMIFDKENGNYYKSLKKILENSNGGTNEQILAKNYAYKKLNEFYGEELYEAYFNTALQEWDGGVRKLASGDTDALFTAQITANTDGYLNTTSAEEYFYEIIRDNNSLISDITASYMGLAALKKPVLTDIKYLLENYNNQIEVLDKINLINALSYIGDYKLALTYYEEEIKPLMTENNDSKHISEEYETFYYQATSRILPTLALTNHEDFEAVLKYVLENETEEYIPVMDLMTFINKYNPTNDCKSKITYTIGDEKFKVDFSKDKIKILELNKTQFEDFKITSTKGEIIVIAEYVGSTEDIKQANDKISITKTVSKGELGGYSTVKLNITFPKEEEDYYIVDDIIPTSSRYVSVSDNGYGYPWSFLKQEGQKLKFYVEPKKSNNITITYKIRNIFLGNFALESAYVTNKAGKVFGLRDNNLLTFDVK